MMGYHAVALGERDLFHGADVLEEGARHLGAPFLSANVIYADTGELLGDPVRWFRMAGFKIAVVGLTRDDFAHELLEQGGRPLAVKSPEGEARRILPQLENEADLVIVLAHLGKERGLALAETTPGIDLIISGHGDRPETEPRQVGTALLVHPPNRGRALGDLTLVLDRDSGLIEWAGGIEVMDREHPDDAELLALVNQCKGRIEEVAEETQVPDTSGGDAHGGGPGEERDPSSSTGAGTSPRSIYEGARSCRECHLELYRSWSETRHARAFTTLEDQGRETDPGCTRCHTTGFGRLNGFRAINFTPEMKDVQCEECHGPGSAHAARLSQAGADTTGELPRGELGHAGVYVCRRCHTKDQDPDFDYQLDATRGSHP